MQAKALLLAVLVSATAVRAQESPAVPDADTVARARLERIVGAEPKNTAALIELGMLEARSKQPEEAIAHLQRATRADPDSVTAWLALGTTACETGKLDLAVAALAQAILLEPHNAKAHSYLGVTFGRKGWRDAASAEFRKALELDDTLADTHFNLAVVYLQETPPARELARRHYRRARELGATPDSLVEKQLKPSKE